MERVEPLRKGLIDPRAAVMEEREDGDGDDETRVSTKVGRESRTELLHIYLTKQLSAAAGPSYGATHIVSQQKRDGGPFNTPTNQRQAMREAPPRIVLAWQGPDE